MRSEYRFRDPALSIDDRIDDLLSHLSLEEKASLLRYDSPPIERLGVPGHVWWSEGIHGISRAGLATVFPQPIGMAASFDTELMEKAADVIATETRAKHHEFARHGDRGIYKGLVLWSPNINIFRDPRWGRGHETYGEDPILTSEMGRAYVRGLQGTDKRYWKAAATIKHFAVHSGPEPERHSFDAQVSQRDLEDTYLVAFKRVVTGSDVAGVMSAYNRINGVPASVHTELLEETLRGEWGFNGYVVSDCGAIEDIHLHHGFTETPLESVATAIRGGCDMDCGFVYRHAVDAWEAGLLTENDIEKAARRVLRIRFKLGQFDPPGDCPYEAIPFEIVDAPPHRALALEMAKKSIVLLKNDGVLPLKREISRIAVIGPNANDTEVLLANYRGRPSTVVTPLQGIIDRAGSERRVFFSEGCHRHNVYESPWGDTSRIDFTEAAAYAEMSDVAIVVLGLGPELEGEEGDAANSDGGGDRRTLSLPGHQHELLERVHSTGTPVVLVMVNGGAVDLCWAHDNVSAIVEAWYGGQSAGSAIAQVLFGDVNPGGRLPVSFVRSLEDLPSFSDYRMEGRTYRYQQAQPLYPFGFGLSYTRFSYDGIRFLNGNEGKKSVTFRSGEPWSVEVMVANRGKRAGDEVIQIYAELEGRWQLVAFSRIHIAAREKVRKILTIPSDVTERFCGTVTIRAAGSQGDPRSMELGATRGVEKQIHVVSQEE